MPLRKGSSKAVIAANIAELIRTGRSRAQAVAIAYAQAGKAKRKPGSRRRAGGVKG